MKQNRGMAIHRPQAQRHWIPAFAGMTGSRTHSVPGALENLLRSQTFRIRMSSRENTKRCRSRNGSSAAGAS